MCTKPGKKVDVAAATKPKVELAKTLKLLQPGANYRCKSLSTLIT
jgi:hypothetical protein